MSYFASRGIYTHDLTIPAYIVHPMETSSDTIIQNTVELTLIPRIGIRSMNRIWKAAPDIGDIFKMEGKRLQALGIPNEARFAIRSRAYRTAADEILNWAVHEGCRLILRGTPEYPILLEEIVDAPLILYARGRLENLNIPCLAVVGSRRPTVYGLQMAQGIASDLGSRGICIVSGMARGIDGAAHRGCMKSGGTTIAVLGCGIDVVYPPEHRQLKEQITGGGLVVSEFPPGTAPNPHNFPIRNRIISGLSEGSLVVEASEKSGSLITARLALEQNREVFAVPGNITSPTSYGPNYLIKQGAKLVQSWKDVVEEMPVKLRENIFSHEETKQKPLPGADLISDEEKKLLFILKLDETTHFDKLYHESSLNIPELSERLLKMEMEGWIRRLPGNMYIRTGRLPEG
jgi:DNA processing protein